MLEQWMRCIEQLEREISPQLFKTWIKPLAYLGYQEEAHSLRIGCPNAFKLNWIKQQWGQRLEELLNDAAPNKPGLGLQFEINIPLDTVREDDEVLQSASSTTGHGLSSPVSNPIASNQTNEAATNEHSRLNRELNFDNFVTGKSNQMARAAALQVSQRPGLEYNPLFIYGGVGLGKTHLMHAVGNAIRERSPGARLRYIHAQEFFDEMVRAIQRKNSEEMRAQYQKLDLFLIDDIQFLSNKPRTQEEFFYLFESLFAARKQIIVTCDTYPKEMSGVEDRLVSRFDSGLIVAIEPPDLETRTAILHRKAELRQVGLPDDVAFFVAKNLRSNVRELEGALNRLVAASTFRGQAITLELAKEALQDLLDLNRPAISVENIQKTVSDYYKLKVADMYSKRRPAHIALARQVAMYLAKELTQKSLPEIGELFGGRDHTTVLHAVRRITERRQHENELNHALKVLEQTLRS
ncbi:MAG: chromosomal replication initiator protein DnaA [Burkholderiaceae bacterium]